MKNTIKLFCFALGFTTLLMACDENKIEVSGGRFEIPEPDKAMRIDSEITRSLLMISREITNSEEIKSCSSGVKLINSGTEILPSLSRHFLDSTQTNVFSKINKRTLTIGEIAIVIANEIRPIPISKVVETPERKPPLDTNIEYYFWKIERSPRLFLNKYTVWNNEEI